MKNKNPDTHTSAGLEFSEDFVRGLLKDKYRALAAARRKIENLNYTISKKDSTIQQRDNIIEQRNAIIYSREAQITFMEASKFWKLREIYFKYHLNILYPGHIYNLVTTWLQRHDNKDRNNPPREDRGKAGGMPQKSIFAPKVTVVVPNYNHEKFLQKRLSTIYKQTYKNFEVILLDDKSADNSLRILKKWANRYKEKTRCIFNAQNTGNVFTQWRRGISQARGQLVWIAESDDYCDEDFLEKLVAKFEDESVMLAYAFPQFVGEDGEAIDFAFEKYVEDISTTKWTKSYVETAHNEVNMALGVKNTIPNVSGVVFRNIPNTEFNYKELEKFKVCGDWYYYLSIIRGGRVAFVRDTTNYYRFHVNNTSSNYQTNKNFVKEYETVAKYIAHNYNIPKQVLNKNRLAVKTVWDSQNPGREKDFYDSYNARSVEREMQKRKPNILMGVYAFTTGGGETVPIRLANNLKDKGYAVTVFEYASTMEDNKTTRNMLNRNIPVITNHDERVDILLKDFGIEIMHSHHASVDVFLAGRENKSIPHVVTTHGLYEMINKKDAITLGPFLEQVTYWVYTAEKNLDTLKKYDWFSRKPLKKIINAAAPPTHARKRPTRKDLGIGEDAFVLCLVSRAIADKGWREAIDAVKIANHISKQQFVILLIGDGPLYDELKEQEKDDDIRLLGFKENLSDYFSLADAGILPSTFKGESFPLVLIECIAVHKPFIGTDIGEVKSMLTLNDGSVAGEVITLRDGIVDVYDIAKSMMKLARDTRYYQACIAAAKILSERYRMGPVVAGYEDIYKDCFNLVKARKALKNGRVVKNRAKNHVT